MDGYSLHQAVFTRVAMAQIIDALDRARVTRPDGVSFRATLFDKSPASNWLVPWHQDTALPVREQKTRTGWGPWTRKGGVPHAIAPAAALETVVALRVQLDDSTSENGPRRVLPGTHTHGVLAQHHIDRLVGTLAPVECLTDAGGVVAMRPLLVHASSKARDARPRRVLHIEYAASTQLDTDIDLALG